MICHPDANTEHVGLVPPEKDVIVAPQKAHVAVTDPGLVSAPCPLPADTDIADPIFSQFTPSLEPVICAVHAAPPVTIT